MNAVPVADPSSLTIGSARAWRALTVAVLTVVIGLGCHVAGGGMPPSLSVVAVVLLIAGPLCWVLSGHRWSARELLATFLLAQAGIHLLSMSPLNGARDMAMAMGAEMAVSHLVGAAALVGFVRWGEAALWGLIEILALRPAAFIVCSVVSIETFALPVLETVCRLVPSTWPHVAAGRAPPSATARLTYA